MQQAVGQKFENRLNKVSTHLPQRALLARTVICAIAAMTPTAMAQVIVGDTTIVAGAHTNDYTFTDTRLPDLSVTGTLSGTVGVFQADSIGTLYNSGAVTGISHSGALSGASGVANTGSITNLSNVGTITGTAGAGIDNSGAGWISAVSNGTAGTVAGSDAAVYNAAQIDVLSNAGSLLGATGIQNAGTITDIENAGTVKGLSAYGVKNADTIGRLTNTGTLSGFQGIYNQGSLGTLSNEVTGRMLGTGTAIDNVGQIATLTNAGLISGVSALVNHSNGAIGAIRNAGTFAGSIYGIQNANGATMDAIQNDRAGVISANTALWNEGHVVGLANAGTIAGGTIGIINDGHFGTLVNGATGNVVGTSESGVLNTGTIDALINHGAIVGGFAAVGNVGGDIGTIFNDGTISGAAFGVQNMDTPASVDNIDNRGLIAAPTAIFNNKRMGTIINTGVIAGNIVNDSLDTLNLVGGSGSIFGTLTGCGGQLGALPCAGTLATGLLSSTRADINLSGNSLLNDRVDLAATGTLWMSAGTLQANQVLDINGNYHQSASATLLIGVNDNANASPSSTASVVDLLNDTAYGRLVVNGSAIIEPGSSVTLHRTGSYAFAAGQRFVVVDALASGTHYNDTALHYAVPSASTLTASGATVMTQTSHGAPRADLVVSLSAATGTDPHGDANADVADNSGADSRSDDGAGAPGNVTPVTYIAGTAESYNAMATLKGLASYSGISNAALLNLYNAGQALNLESSTAARQAGDKLSPVSQTNALRAAMTPTYDVMRVLGTRIDSLRLGSSVAQTGISSGEAQSTKMLWGQAFGGHASQNQRDEVAGYSANFGGLILGADKAINEQWRAGGAFSYSNTGISSSGDLSGNTTRVNGYGLFGYASYVAPTWYANFSAGAGYQNYQQTRQVDFTGFSGSTNARFGGSQLVVRGEVGYPLAIGAATLTPLASLSYAYMRQNGYTESGGNGAALRVDAAHATSIQSDVGVKGERAYTSHYGVLIPNVQVAWRHQYAGQKTSIAAQFAADPLGETRFTTRGATPVLDTAMFSAGLTLLRANNLSVTAQYILQAGKGYLSQAGTVRLRQLF